MIVEREIAKNLKFVCDKLYPGLGLSETWFLQRVKKTPKNIKTDYSFNTIELTRMINNEE